MAEKEYIDRQAAIDSLLGWAAQLTETYGKNDEYVRCLESAAYNIEQIPAAEVRPVVRCRECAHWERYDNTAGCGYCHKVKFEYGADGYMFNPVREPDFYCADGEKREES